MPDAVQAKQQILAALESGPQLPKDIQQKMQPKVDSFLLGALLSELTGGSKQVKNTHMKIGSSSIHYLPKHAEQLQQFADRLKGPEKEGYELLVQKKLLPLEELEPRLRVALDHVKDFAKKISILYGGKEHLFYRWYLLSDEETKMMITSYLTQSSKETAPVQQKVVQEEQVTKQQVTEQQVTEQQVTEQQVTEQLVTKQDEPESKQVFEDTNKEPEQKKEETPAIQEEELNVSKEEAILEKPQEKEPVKKLLKEEKQPIKENKKPIKETMASRPEPLDMMSKQEPQEHTTSPLMQRLKAKGMRIDHYKMINKKDMLFEGLLTTSFGQLRCRVIVKKKKVTDADLVECIQYKEDVLVVLCNGVSKKAEKNAAQLGILLEEL